MLISLLFIIMAFGILKIILEIKNQYKCLDDNALHKFMTNRLSKDAKAKVTTHLGLCEKCQQRLRDYNFSDNVQDHLIEADN